LLKALLIWLLEGIELLEGSFDPTRYCVCERILPRFLVLMAMMRRAFDVLVSR